MLTTLTWPEVWRRRLARHSLSERAPRAMLLEVVGTVCGIHAQMPSAAELSLAARVDGATRRAVHAALWDARSLVKTYGIRGTLHMFPASELPLWMAALRCRSDARELRRLAQFGLSASQLAAVVDAIGRALDGRRLTTRQLGEEVARLAGAWALDETAPAFGGRWPRWRMALGRAAAAGQLCCGPNEGTQVTFVRPDQWLGTWRDADPRDSLVEVYRRFVRAYGPVTYAEFAQWFAAPRQLARDVQSDLGSELVEVDVEGDRRMLMADDLSETFTQAETTVRLLPHFDCYLRGGHPRSRLVGGWADKSAGGTGQAPVLLIDGVVGGIWQRRGSDRTVEVRVDPFVTLTRRQRVALDAEAARIGAFLETEVCLSVGNVEVRPHM